MVQDCHDGWDSAFPLQRVRVRSLVRELRLHWALGTAKTSRETKSKHCKVGPDIISILQIRKSSHRVISKITQSVLEADWRRRQGGCLPRGLRLAKVSQELVFLRMAGWWLDSLTLPLWIVFHFSTWKDWATGIFRAISLCQDFRILHFIWAQ